MIRKSTGFTLVELLVVLILVGLASSLVVPDALRVVNSYKRFQELEKIPILISNIQLRARAERRDYVILLQASNVKFFESDVFYYWKPYWTEETSGQLNAADLSIPNEAETGASLEGIILESALIIVTRGGLVLGTKTLRYKSADDDQIRSFTL